MALATGGRFNPVSNCWTTMSMVNAPTARRGVPGLWTGSEFLVWGGINEAVGVPYHDGKRYNPTADVWVPMSTDCAPSDRYAYNSVWTGTEMAIFGGSRRGDSPYLAAPYSYSSNRRLYLYLKP